MASRQNRGKLARNSVPTRNGRVSTQQLISRQLRTVLNGTPLKNQYDPPTINSSPWCQMTVAIRFPSASGAGNTRSAVTNVSLKGDIYSQLGFPATVPTGVPDIELRVRTVKAWATNRSENILIDNFNMDVYDLINSSSSDNNRRLLTTLSDNAGKNHWASVGYSWPKAQQSYTIEDGTSYIVGFDRDVATEVVVYINLLWRFHPPQSSVEPTVEHQLVFPKSTV